MCRGYCAPGTAAGTPAGDSIDWWRAHAQLGYSLIGWIFASWWISRVLSEGGCLAKVGLHFFASDRVHIWANSGCRGVWWGGSHSCQTREDADKKLLLQDQAWRNRQAPAARSLKWVGYCDLNKMFIIPASPYQVHDGAYPGDDSLATHYQFLIRIELSRKRVRLEHWSHCKATWSARDIHVVTAVPTKTKKCSIVPGKSPSPLPHDQLITNMLSHDLALQNIWIHILADAKPF